MILLVIIVVMVGLAFSLRSGLRASDAAAVEHDPLKRTIHHGEVGCMGILFALIGMVGVLALIALSFPGK